MGTRWNASLPGSGVQGANLFGEFSPVNEERAAGRGEKLKKRPISRADLQDDRSHLILPSSLPSAAEREGGRALGVPDTVCSVRP
jgi:hypothetical protein